MADVTLKLIWYRLGEASANMADRWEKFLDWYEHFSLRRVDILDMLFLGWLLAAFLVVGAINIYLKFFGRPKLRGIGGETGGGFLGFGGVSASAGPGESCQWVNALFSWLYLHYDSSPEFVDNWLRSLNEQARKHTVNIFLCILLICSADGLAECYNKYLNITHAAKSITSLRVMWWHNLS